MIELVPSARTARSFRFAMVALLGVVGASCDQVVPPAAGGAPQWLLDRVTAERSQAAASSLRHEFSFTDRLAESGITFVNRIVDDAGKAYKPVHYDHGTGIASADVDGDGLPDLFLVSQLGRSELWRNLGGGRFADMSTEAGLSLEDVVGVGASFADIDNDGDPDLFVTTVRHGNRLYENVGSGRFRDISEPAGVRYSGHSSGAVFFDYDADGRLDLLVTNVGAYTTDSTGHGGYHVGMEGAFFAHVLPDRAESSILYRNLGGNRFRDVSRQVGFVDLSWSGDATPIDVNDDGFLDLYLLNMQGENHLWVNEGGKRFRDSTGAYFPRTPFGAMGVKVFDFDGDQRLDLFLTDMHSDMFDEIQPGDWAAEARKSNSTRMPPQLFTSGKTRLMFGNALFQRRPPGTREFAEVSDRAGLESYWPWGPSVDDLNADGWDDIFIAAGMNFPFRYAPNNIFLNEAGQRFLPAAFALGAEPRAGGRTDQVWFTLACEAGGADAGTKPCEVCAAPDAEVLGCRRDPAGQLTMRGALGSRSAVILDLDGDGDLDVVTNEFNAGPQVLVSDLSDRGPVQALRVRLRGTRSNSQGLGAAVTVVLPDGRRILKVADGRSGYLSQSDLPLYFGLGAASAAASVEVAWPSGRRQTIPGPLRPGQILEILEP